MNDVALYGVWVLFGFMCGKSIGGFICVSFGHYPSTIKYDRGEVALQAFGRLFFIYCLWNLIQRS